VLVSGNDEKMRHRQANVVAPHRDDAAFSIAMTISRLAAADIAIKIISCFTVSEWAPHAPLVSRREPVTAIRAEEDERFVALLGARASLASLHLLDGPLRPDSRAYKTWPDVDTGPLPAEICAALESRLTPLNSGADVWLLPLALEHRDHCIARAAALAVAGRKPLLFYEDVPYIFWFDDAEVRRRIRQLEALLECELLPVVLHEVSDLGFWLQAAAIYRSQFSMKQIASMYRLLQARGGERVWITHDFIRWLASSGVSPRDPVAGERDREPAQNQQQ
jgi:LmbE family N-acetylglucosaminyl deacetylase